MGEAVTKFGKRVQCEQCVGSAIYHEESQLLEARWFRTATGWACGTHDRKRTPARPTPTKDELRVAIKTHGYGWAIRNLDDDGLIALTDGFNGREHTTGRDDYWRLGRELAGLDKP